MNITVEFVLAIHVETVRMTEVIMKYIKEVLDKLTKNDMHVHEIDLDDTYPFYYTPHFDTHFILKDADVVFVGNITSLESWVLQY